jgi:glycosyltransferase involved in cell wall biosynthesis
VSSLVRLRGLVERPDLAIVHRFRPPPYGGSNQFLTALRGELRRRGLRVSDGAIGPRTRACLLHSYLVDLDELRRALRPGVRVVHRVDGPITLYRGRDDGADRRIDEINHALADATIFQSRYSIDAHRELGIELRNPVLIPNAVDAAIFHPPAAREPLPGRRVRVIAASWSDNPKKGGPTYAWLAGNLDRARYELTFVGRASEPVPAEHVVGPVGSAELAAILRRQDVYLTASRNEACSNAVLEALACGLPTLYVRSGSNGELVGEAGFGFERDDELPELLDRLVDEYDERRARISILSLAEVADRYLDVLGLA